MNAFIRKEIRLLLPAWVAGLLLATVPVWFMRMPNPMESYRAGYSVNSMDPYGISFLAIGTLLVGLSSFGRELSSGTFSQLLAQPLPRWRIWTTKVSVLLALLLPVLVAWYLSCELRLGGTGVIETPGRMGYWGGIVILTALAGTFWTVLLLRQIIGAFVFSLFIPLLIPLLMLATSEDHGVHPHWLFPCLGIYALAGFGGSLWMFLRAQDVGWTGGTVSLPAWRTGNASPARTGRSFMALLVKELQFQQGMLLPVVLLLGVNAALFALRLVRHDQLGNFWQEMAEMGWSLWLFIPVLTGCLAVAEERKLGTFESQLCLPVGRSLQFTFKLAVALGLGLVFGIGMPLVLDTVGGALGLHRSLLTSGIVGESLARTGIVVIGLVLVAFYVSTLTRSLIQALGAAVVMSIITGILLMLARNAQPVWDSIGIRLWSGSLGFLIFLPGWTLALLGLAFANFKRVEVGGKVWRHNLVVLVGVLVLALAGASTVYHRAWEQFQTLEPAHGPAELSGPVTAKIAAVHTNLYVLLPDGRLWGMTYNLVWDSASTNRDHHLKKILRQPNGFIDTHHWIDLAAGYSQAVAVRDDGSLWSLFRLVSVDTNRWQYFSTPERIGTDSDWKSVASGGSHFLALKADGTIWGAGRNYSGQLGEGAEIITNLVQVGHDADWVRIFAGPANSTGIKRDGSAWKWGTVGYDVNGNYRSDNIFNPTPQRLSLTGTNIVSLNIGDDINLMLRSDGTAWAKGRLRGNFWGNPTSVSPTTNFIRVDKTADWLVVNYRWPMVVVLKTDHSLWAAREGQFGRYGAPFRFSTHDDWLAIQMNPMSTLLALAADGTLSCWQDTEGDRDPRSIMRPSHRPAWSLNVLAGAGSEPKP